MTSELELLTRQRDTLSNRLRELCDHRQLTHDEWLAMQEADRRSSDDPLFVRLTAIVDRLTADVPRKR